MTCNPSLEFAGVVFCSLLIALLFIGCLYMFSEGFDAIGEWRAANRVAIGKKRRAKGAK